MDAFVGHSITKGNNMTREDAIKRYRELMIDLREAASTGLDMSPGDPLAGRALAALEALIDSLPNAKAQFREERA